MEIYGLKLPRFSSTTSYNATESSHPYFPRGIILKDYARNDRSVQELLFVFASGVSLVLAIALILAKFSNPKLRKFEIARLLWFVLCGSLHTTFEGYFVLNSSTIPSLQTLYAQLWKEYALSDSRYLTQDTLVLCLEAITVCAWGPLSFIIALLIVRESPFQHPLQIVVCTGHIFSDTLYYATSIRDHAILDISYSRPEPHYFWGYYVLMNAFWIIIPAALLVQSILTTADSLRAHRKVTEILAALEKTDMRDRKKKS